MSAAPDATHRPAPSRSPRLKGQTFLAIIEHVAIVHGREGVELLRNTLSPAERAEVDALGWGAWRSYELWTALARSAALLFAGSRGLEGQMAFIERAGAFGAERDLTVMRRMLMRVASPALLIERAPLLWMQFNDTGRLSATSVTSRRAEAELQDWPHPDVLFCAMVQGWMRRYLELCGANEVVMVHTECRGRDDTSCRWTARWSDR